MKLTVLLVYIKFGFKLLPDTISILFSYIALFTYSFINFFFRSFVANAWKNEFDQA
jgi:hypothetical protein